MPIAFIDLAAQQSRIRDRIDAAIARVLDHGAYIMGPEVAALEADIAAFCGARHAIACANGTDALQLALMALGVGPGDAVFCPSFTFAATAEVVPLVGATPVFVDVDAATCNMDASSLRRAIAHARAIGLKPTVVIPVDLFGLPADYNSLEAIAREEGLSMICDSAQGFGARHGDRVTGSIGDLATTSFFPAKPLGCYGDGGAVFCHDDEIAAKLKSLRVHGKGTDKYDNVRIGLNSRLDTIQAAILIEKLAIYGEEIEARQKVAARYSAGLGNLVEVPGVPEGMTSVWAQYTVKCPDGVDRASVMASMKDAGIPTVVYYPIPLHLQTAYSDAPRDPQGLPVAEALAGKVFSLPMHPYLAESDQDRIIDALSRAVAG